MCCMRVGMGCKTWGGRRSTQVPRRGVTAKARGVLELFMLWCLPVLPSGYDGFRQFLFTLQSWKTKHSKVLIFTVFQKLRASHADTLRHSVSRSPPHLRVTPPEGVLLASGTWWQATSGQMKKERDREKEIQPKGGRQRAHFGFRVA